ncbi:OLC1v1012752C1 [Oldenlandia corymbosa var. corymbosa]|uniref:OLC1v1012752C1 n=1 Tax=Oldenlandia corymbosa var. corymbosa TaxID=529605 RepID=A0AAV1DZN7_OLDCO|nr:OLC1v1012752C1 [Oldenlandia corymbosa var. corymbosa]
MSVFVAKWFMIWLLFIGLFSLPTASCSLTSRNLKCNKRDMKVLVDFYNGLKLLDLDSSGIADWDVNSSASNCCNWVGITCKSSWSLGLNDSSEDDSGRVVTFEVTGRSLVGKLPMSLGNLDQLRELNLSRNFLTGSIPSTLLHLSRLEVLDLSYNQFTGLFPVIIISLPSLRVFKINDNQFSGNLSDNIGNLSSLVQLDISRNNFSGKLPNVFHSLSMLSNFAAQSNNFTGSIPESLGSSPTLTVLDLRNNSLGDTLDLDCTAMLNLVSLDLGSNQFRGSIPENLPKCQRLKRLNLAKNHFDGQIPESFKNFQSLSYLSLSNTSIYNLSSALATLQHCRNLTSLVLTLNFWDEPIPSDSALRFSELKALVIANCRLIGTLPLWLSNSNKLQVLDLSWNRLEGEIPSWFGGFKFLFYLSLSNNSFSGEIPVELTQLESLVHGKNFPDDPYLHFPINFKKSVTSKGLQYNQISSLPPSLDLGNNFFTGPIWPEFGNLKYLIFLNLKCNNLSGAIPSDLSSMRNLETLDLSYNNLSGTIPPSLTNLNFLSMFSVAYNKLSGVIPTGGQFETFPSSSFIGNQDLCGVCSSPCPESSQLRHAAFWNDETSRSIIKSEWLWGFCLGLFSSLLSCWWWLF